MTDFMLEMLEYEFINLFIRIGLALVINFIAFKITDVVFEFLNKNKKNRTIHIKFLRQVIKGTIAIVSILYIISNIPILEKYIVSVLASSSLLIVVLGFAAQEALSNIINGLFISVFKPFEIGDRIKMVNNEIAGYIEDISLRHTIIKTFNNSRIIIPNSVMNKEMIENSHFKDVTAGMFIDVSVSYESNIRHAIVLMQEVIDNHPSTIDMRSEQDKLDNRSKTSIFVRDLGDSGISLRANVWTATIDESFSVCSDIRLRIKESFDANGIEIPYPRIKLA